MNGNSFDSDLLPHLAKLMFANVAYGGVTTGGSAPPMSVGKSLKSRRGGSEPMVEPDWLVLAAAVADPQVACNGGSNVSLAALEVHMAGVLIIASVSRPQRMLDTGELNPGKSNARGVVPVVLSHEVKIFGTALPLLSLTANGGKHVRSAENDVDNVGVDFGGAGRRAPLNEVFECFVLN